MVASCSRHLARFAAAPNHEAKRIALTQAIAHGRRAAEQAKRLTSMPLLCKIRQDVAASKLISYRTGQA